MYYAGIDLGTSAVKLLLMDEKGTIIRIVSREYPIYFPHPGWSEQDPEDWYRETVAGLKELLDNIDRKALRGISFGGQMHGLVAVDGEDRVIRRAILWNDGRSTEACDYLNHTVGKEIISAHTANVAFAGFTAPKLIWMKKYEPELFARIHRIMLPKDYIAWRMTGVHSTDVSDASGMLLLDVKNRRWSDEMCELCGISKGQLPQLFESYEAIGTIRQELAEELGVGRDVIVAAGAGDNAAAAVATGTVEDGSCNLSLGTSGTIFIAQKEFRVDPNNALHSFCDASGAYHLMGCMLSAASCNKWWMDDILKTGNYNAEQQMIEKLGENQVFFLPYLMGERSPHNDPDARATFTGMTMDTTRADMTQAVLEGVTFGLRDSYEVAKSLGLNVTRTKLVGGGARSRLWQTMTANIMNLPVDLLSVEEGPSLGGAMLAATADGVYQSVEEAAKAIVRVETTVEPEPVLAEKYNERYNHFSKIYPSMKELFQELR